LVEDSTVATHMFRIAQESVTNAVRHAKPRRIVIGLYYERDALVLSIRDDGLGLPKFQQSTDGMGMQVMQHRASMIGAKFTATRGRRRGTAVCCRLPLQGVKK
jgi:signal transduction histidine kinase